MNDRQGDHEQHDLHGGYVRQALLLQGYALTDGQQAGVAAAFAGIAAVAAVLMQDELPLEAEPAPVFLP